RGGRPQSWAASSPAHSPRHRERPRRMPIKGSPGRQRAARWALASGLGYEALRDANVSLATKIRGRRLLRRIRWSCPPWIGAGRYLDVGCGSGGALGVARALGWRVAGLGGGAGRAPKGRPLAATRPVGAGPPAAVR